MKEKKKLKMPKRTSILTLAALLVLLVAFVLLCTITVAKRKETERLEAQRVTTEKIESETGSVMNEEMMSELDDIGIYLSTLEKGVADNRATLEMIQNSKESSEIQKEMDSQKTMLSSIFEKVTGVGNAMNANSDSILGGVGNYFANLKASIDKLGDSNSSFFDEIASRLDSLTGKNEALKSEINSKYESLNQNLSGQINGVNESIKNVDKSMKEEISNVNNRFDTFNTEIGATIVADNSNLNAYLQAAFEGINGKIDQVFQYASSGKNLLASTLSGYPDAYRVETSADAPFETIKNNVDTAIELAINYGKSLNESNENVILTPPEASVTIYAHFCDNTDEDHTKVFSSWNEYQEYLNSHNSLDNSMPGGCFAQSPHQEYECTGSKRCGTYEVVSSHDGTYYFECSGCGNRVSKYVGVPTGPGWGAGDHYVNEYGYVSKGYYDTVCGYHNGQIFRIEVAY